MKFDEKEGLLSLLASLDLKAEHRILDVGCGYGRNLRSLRESGLKGVGIDINPSIVRSNLANGLDCMTPDEFDKTCDFYDLIIMAHVIEHFLPADLLQFIEHYLARLKIGGHLIIIAPLMWPCFFSNFDHLKPYPPQAIESMFSVDNFQAQYCSKYRLELVEIRVRRRPIWLSPGQELYLKQEWPRIERRHRKLLGALYKLSFGLIGCTDGWIGLYRNKGLRNQ